MVSNSYFQVAHAKDVLKRVFRILAEMEKENHPENGTSQMLTKQLR